MPKSVYARSRSTEQGLVLSHSTVRAWADWPEDVVEVLRSWNKGKRLRFEHLSWIFVCWDCSRNVDTEASTAAVLDGGLYCDDCLISRVRRFGALGRQETELEKAQRWQRNTQKKLARYRHNALTEAAYVRALRAALSRLAADVSVPRTEEAAAVQIEVEHIAREALATRVCQSCFSTRWADGRCVECGRAA